MGIIQFANYEKIKIMERQSNPYRQIIINSSLLFISASLIQMTIHELGHMLAGLYYHSKDVSLYHNYVKHDISMLSIPQKIVIAAAGPIIGLCMGIFFHVLCLLNKTRGNIHLFHCYMAAFGYIDFFGYLMVAPFFRNGDTGFIFTSLGFSFWLEIIIAVLGAGFCFIALKKLSASFIELATNAIIDSAEYRRKFANALIQTPMYIGIIGTTLLNLPAPAVLSLIYPICSPFSLMWPYGYLLEENYPNLKMNQDFDTFNKVHYTIYVLFIVSVFINRLLVFGWHVN